MNNILNLIKAALLSVVLAGAATFLTDAANAANPNSKLTLLPAGTLHFETILGSSPGSTQAVLTLTNTGRRAIRWGAATDANWIELSPAAGLVGPRRSDSVTLTLRDLATLSVGQYVASVLVTNRTGAHPPQTLRVVLTIRLAAPELVPEPAFSRGTSNSVAWRNVPGANEYRVEASTTLDFLGAVSSPWLRMTNYTFTNLLDGVTYSYRVQSRSNSLQWSQTLAAQFATNENHNVSTRYSPGQIVLDGNTNRIWFEDFDEPGDSWTNTLFNDLRWATTSIGSIVPGATAPAGFSRLPLDDTTFAPNTVPPLPINQNGDNEGYITRAIGFHRYAYMASSPENRIRDVTVDAHIALNFPPGSFYSEAGIVLRGDPTTTNNFTGGNGDLAQLSPDHRLDLFTMDHGIRFNSYVEPRDSFPSLFPNEIYHLRFSAIGDRLTALLWRIHAQDDIIYETPVDFGGGNFERVSTSSVYTNGLVGLSGIAWGGNSSVMFDDITIVSRDSAPNYARKGTSTVLVEPPNWFVRWGRLDYTRSVSSPKTKLTVDVLDPNGKVLAKNVRTGADLGALPALARVSKLRLRANLSTRDAAQTPALSDWTVTWQLPAENPSESAFSDPVASTQDNQPPVLRITSPTADPYITHDRLIIFTGTATDEGAGVLRTRSPAFLAETTNAFTNWTLTVQLLNPGTNLVFVVASDRAVPANFTIVTNRVVYVPASPQALGELTAGIAESPNASGLDETVDESGFGLPPNLRIVYAKGNIMVNWSPVLPGDQLQTATTLRPADWTDAPGANSGSFSAPLEKSYRFFRVIHR